MNSIHPEVQFKVYNEKHEKLLCLEISFIKNTDGSIEYDWYSKPTSSDTLSDLFSNHPFRHKLNVIDQVLFFQIVWKVLQQE